MSNHFATVQALLYVAGEDGMSLEQLSFLLEIERAAVRQIVEELATQLRDNENSGLEIIQTASEYKLVTKPIFEETISKYAVSPFMSQLSSAAMETLAIIAYKQPITRIAVDEIRGVQSSGSIQKLLLRDLIEEAGRLEAPGRPKLYRTTRYFMDYFGLQSLDQLPDIENLFDMSTEQQALFQTKPIDNLEQDGPVPLVEETVDTTEQGS